MPSEHYYVRVRGRVSGPFEPAQLEELVRQGTLSRIHEISPDKLNWTTAGGLEFLFPPAPPLLLETEPSTESSSLPPGAAEAGAGDRIIPFAREGEPVASPSDAAPQGRYYYEQGGAIMGPLSLTELRTLATNKRLRPFDLVCQEGDQEWVAAGQSAGLAPVFGGE